MYISTTNQHNIRGIIHLSTTETCSKQPSYSTGIRCIWLSGHCSWIWWFCTLFVGQNLQIYVYYHSIIFILTYKYPKRSYSCRKLMNPQLAFSFRPTYGQVENKVGHHETSPKTRMAASKNKPFFMLSMFISMVFLHLWGEII